MEELQKSLFDIHVHDVKYTVKAEDITPEMTLNDYLRKVLGLTGTKVMCREGGCGVCIVAVTRKDPLTGKDQTFSVNSCMVSIYSCNSWKISTVEGIGNRKTGFHPIQSALAKFNGTQCGFCSSGMIMNMFALYQNKTLTMKEIENSFGGNLCRCTGYRSILSAFKQYAADFEQSNIGNLIDIEELDFPSCKRKNCEKTCTSPCNVEVAASYTFGDDDRWYNVNTVREIIDVFNINPKKKCRMVGGNTARGIYKSLAKADIYINVTTVKEMLVRQMNTNEYIIGGAVSLTDTMEAFYSAAKNDPNFSYLSKMADHIDLIAHVPVRNIGTLGGNLSIKHAFNEFPSDIFLILETVGARITIVDSNYMETTLRMVDYLKFNMDKKVIKSITLRSLDSSYKYQSYKIMPRAQNAHAVVNAGFLFQFDKNNTVLSAKIVYGNINPTFIHATKAEGFIVGKKLFDNAVMQNLFTILESEIKSDSVLPEPSPEYRNKLAVALCYKFILSIAPNVSAVNKSGGQILQRPVSSGTQDYTTNELTYPISQPVNKIEALAQTSGEAKFIIDTPHIPEQTYAAFVLAKAPAKSKILKIDPSPALKVSGVISFVGVNDIPGKNTFTAVGVSLLGEDEEIFCSGTIKYYHQPIGLIVAKTQEIAEEAVELVAVQYSISTEKPCLTIQQAIQQKKDVHDHTLLPKRKGTDKSKAITGKMNVSWQYHFHMETQICNAVPIENGEFDLYPGTQWMDLAQCAGAFCLKIPLNKINVQVRRVGGSYGAKISRNALVSCAALVACNKIQKPVMLCMPFTDNMNVIGKRNPNYMEFTNNVNDQGVIQSLNMTTYTDYGIHGNDAPLVMMERLLLDTYLSDTYEISVNHTTTDTPACSWTRAPGSTEGLAMIESVMEQTAVELNLDPLELRLANITDETLKKTIKELKTWAKIDEIKAANKKFNTENRWRKRGLSVVPMAYKLLFEGSQNVIITAYQGDGTVSISHSGIELGQGINTKAIQVVAYYLGIGMELVSCKPSNNLIGPNAMTTGGSITSESVCMALKSCCEELLKRMADVKKANPSDDWPTLVKKAFYSGVNLCVTSIYAGVPTSNYMIYGVASAEVEIDILTGNMNTTRVHLLEDAGDSMSPIIDIGQVEGAYIMGMGYYTTEHVVLDPKTGELKSNRTWNYKPPGAKDIPIEFKVKFPANNPNPLSPFKTKATAEPPFCLTAGIPLAVRDAIKSARLDASKDNKPWYPIDGPCTVEDNFMKSENNYKQYTL